MYIMQDNERISMFFFLKRTQLEKWNKFESLAKCGEIFLHISQEGEKFKRKV